MLKKFFYWIDSPLRNFYILAIAVCLFLSGARPCLAQYFGLGNGLGYSGLGSSLLYPFSYLFYGGYGSSYASPLYGAAALGGGFLNNTIYNSYRNIPYNYMGNYPYNNNYANPSLSNSPASTSANAPFNYYNNAGSQYQGSTWNYSPNPNTFNQTSPGPNFPGQTAAGQVNPYNQNSNDPNDIFNVNLPNKANNAQPAPPTAPSRHLAGTIPDQPSQYLQDSRSLDGFFQSVNIRYKGNLLHALNQMDMHAWAESLGLIAPGFNLPKNLNSARKSELSAIAKDPSLNSQRKLDILRLLLASP